MQQMLKRSIQESDYQEDALILMKAAKIVCNEVFLSHSIELMVCREGKQIFTTNGTKVIARGTIHQMQECNHEEADTRLLVHLLDAIADGVTTCLVRTVDTDVIIIFAGKMPQLLIYGWLLALESISGMCTSMLSAVLLENRNPWHFLSFTPLLVVTQLLDFLGKEKSQHGKHGNHFQR